LTKPNGTQRNDKLMQMVDAFAKDYEEAKTDGNAQIAFLEGILETVNTRLGNSVHGSPEYYELREMQHFLNLEIRIQYEMMLNANNHYMLALHVAIAMQRIEKHDSTELAEEVKRIAEELRKTDVDAAKKRIDEHIAKRLGQLFDKDGKGYIG
jgi:DNA-binding GntR family transcriptional regulator